MAAQEDATAGEEEVTVDLGEDLVEAVTEAGAEVDVAVAGEATVTEMESTRRTEARSSTSLKKSFRPLPARPSSDRSR